MANNKELINLKNKYKSHFARYQKAFNSMKDIELNDELIRNKDQNMKELMIVRDSFSKMKHELKNMTDALRELQKHLTNDEINQLIDDPDLTDLDKIKTAYLLIEIQYLGIDYEITGNQQSQIKLKRIIEQDAPELQNIIKEEMENQ